MMRHQVQRWFNRAYFLCCSTFFPTDFFFRIQLFFFTMNGEIQADLSQPLGKFVIGFSSQMKEGNLICIGVCEKVYASRKGFSSCYFFFSTLNLFTWGSTLKQLIASQPPLVRKRLHTSSSDELLTIITNY